MLTESVRRVTGAMERAGVTWAVGASLMLYCRGIATSPRDIDIMVAPEDTDPVDSALLQIGRRLPGNPHADYATRRFLEYEVNGVDVDVMAGFIIRRGGREYEYILRKDELEPVALDGTTLPLCPLEDWLVLYGLMRGREAKVALIEDYLLRKGVRGGILERWLGLGLPDELAAKVQALTKTAPKSQ